MREPPIRVLIAKPGLDGHDRGALVVAQGLRDMGMEVIYTGLRQTPAQIVATAIEEDVACIGLSSLSGAHLELFPEVARLLKEQHADDILLIGGGVIPREDIPVLKAAGIAEVFGPGSSIGEMAAFIRAHVRPGEDRSDKSAAGWDLECIDHVGIAVSSLAEAYTFYVQCLGLQVHHEETLQEQQVRIAWLTLGETALELLEPLSADSPIAKFLAKRGPGLHHIAYAVPDIKDALVKAAAAGIRVRKR
ncbi:MAG: cobalamin-dependent protein [Alicyclobacillus sp.]|nr:cobalamin-dependent protein [Alicyclobacillus sp.]